MFGYITINKQELKIKDFEKYQSYYCGLCSTLKKYYGRLGQVTLTYDMTFLVIFLTALYESESIKGTQRCVLHPVKKHSFRRNEFTQYGADMNIALTYYKLLDDWEDEKSIKGKAGAGLFRKRFQRIEEKYKRQCSVMKESLGKLKIYENQKEGNLDAVSGCFGGLISELFVYKKDTWEESLRKFGFFLGKYIYLLDAYDDMEKDKRNNSYNPFLYRESKGNLKEEVADILAMMMSECAREFEKLPILWEADLLRNIIYSGVWIKYQDINNRKDTMK